jgi:hypothetical protein
MVTLSNTIDLQERLAAAIKNIALVKHSYSHTASHRE